MRRCVDRFLWPRLDRRGRAGLQGEAAEKLGRKRGGCCARERVAGGAELCSLGLPGGGQTLPPQFLQRAVIKSVRSAQRFQISADRRGFVRDQGNRRQAQAAHQFPQPQAREASVEIRERMDGEQPTLGERECFGHLLDWERLLQSRPQIQGVSAHVFGHARRGRRFVRADAHGQRSPASGPVGDQVAAEIAVQRENQFFRDRAMGVAIGLDAFLHPQDPFGQQRG